MPCPAAKAHHSKPVLPDSRPATARGSDQNSSGPPFGGPLLLYPPKSHRACWATSSRHYSPRTPLLRNTKLQVSRFRPAKPASASLAYKTVDSVQRRASRAQNRRFCTRFGARSGTSAGFRGRPRSCAARFPSSEPCELRHSKERHSPRSQKARDAYKTVDFMQARPSFARK